MVMSAIEKLIHEGKSGGKKLEYCSILSGIVRDALHDDKVKFKAVK